MSLFDATWILPGLFGLVLVFDWGINLVPQEIHTSLWWRHHCFVLCSVHSRFRVSESTVSSAVITWLNLTSVKLVFMWLNWHDVTWAAFLSQMETDTYSAASSKWKTQRVVFGAKHIQSQNVQPSSYDPRSLWFPWLFAHSWWTMMIPVHKTGEGQARLSATKNTLCWHWLVICNDMFVVVTKADDVYYY